MPVLDDAAFEELKASIKAHGVLIALEYSASGELLDGHHRLAACKSLGIKAFPRVVRGAMSDSETRAHIRALNVVRRHLSPVQRAEHVAAMRDEGWSTRRIAAETGLSQRTVVRDLQAAGDPTTPVTGLDGKTYKPKRPTTVHATSNAEQERAQKALSTLGDGAPGRQVDLRRLERLARDKTSGEARTGRRLPGPGGVTITCESIENLEIEAGTVDLILTDPPYLAADMESGIWDILAKRASDWLKPGGLLITHTPNQFLSQALISLASGSLEYWWTIALNFDTSTGVAQVRQRNLGNTWRPLLVFRQPGPNLPPWSLDSIRGAGRSKDTGHPWEQAAAEAQQLIETFTQPNGLVVDPFLGSGSTALGAQAAGRRFVGADIEQRWVDLTLERLAEAGTPELSGDSRLAPRVTVDDTDATRR